MLLVQEKLSVAISLKILSMELEIILQMLMELYGKQQGLAGHSLVILR